MITGCYNIKIDGTGRFYMPANMLRHFEACDHYCVFAGEETEADGTPPLVFVPEDKTGENGQTMKKYKTPKDGRMRIPARYRESFSGECVLLGAGDFAELYTKEGYSALVKLDGETEDFLNGIDALVL